MSPLTCKRALRDLLLTFATLLGLGLFLLCIGGAVALLEGIARRERRQDSARLDLLNIRVGLSRYALSHGGLPSTEQGLKALVEARVLERSPIDPWGRPYQYSSRGEISLVWSYGADGLPGGKDENEDVLCQVPLRERGCGWPRPAR